MPDNTTPRRSTFVSTVVRNEEGIIITSHRHGARPRAFALAWGCAALAVSALPAAAWPRGATVGGTPDNVDTGIRKNQCYSAGMNAMTSCDAADIPGQDGQLGRDVDPATNSAGNGPLGLSFTRICNSGKAAGKGSCPKTPVLGDGPDDWGCVKDDLTKMMWEVKTITGFRAGDLKYTNYSVADDPFGEYGSPTDATGYVNAVNAAQLCGYSDWGLAHTDKVQTILDYGIATAGAARVDANFFPDTDADWYWNDSPNLSSLFVAFAVNFADGSASNDALRSTPRHVQVVRNAKASTGPGGRYEYSTDGAEVIGTAATARLTWRRCVEGMSWNGKSCTGTALAFTHEQALQWAAQQALATGVAWRVPNVKELGWIVDREEPSPTTRHDAFPATPAEATWTSTPEVRQPRAAWAVDFRFGLVTQRDRGERLVLRLARDSGG